MTQKVLFVDDSIQLLSAIRRRLRRELDLTTAESGAEALQIIEEEGPFAVLVTDQNMPGMDGVELLQAIYKSSPQTVRIMMTGQTDTDTTVEAINKGHVYSLLNKPCSPEDVLAAVKTGLERFEAQNMERTLLEQTLAGSVKLLVDVIALQNSEIAKVPAYARGWAKSLAHHVEGVTAWELDLALMLSPIGRITLPIELQQKLEAGADLSTVEQALVDECPRAARNLLGNIPRLEKIAEAIFYQNASFNGEGFPGDGVKGLAIPVMARILRVLHELITSCQMQEEPISLVKAFSDLTRNSKHLDPYLFDLCKEVLTDKRLLDGTKTQFSTLEVGVNALMDGDLLEGDIRTIHNSLVLKTGIILTPPMIQKVIQVNNHIGIETPIKIMRRTVSTAA